MRLNGVGSTFYSPPSVGQSPLLPAHHLVHMYQLHYMVYSTLLLPDDGPAVYTYLGAERVLSLSLFGYHRKFIVHVHRRRNAGWRAKLYCRSPPSSAMRRKYDFRLVASAQHSTPPSPKQNTQQRTHKRHTGVRNGIFCGACEMEIEKKRQRLAWFSQEFLSRRSV